MGKQTVRGRRELIATIGMALALVVLALSVVIDNYQRTHFLAGTTIQGVDCSELTVKEAKERIEKSEVKIHFSSGGVYQVPGNEIGRTISTSLELQGFLMKQNQEDGESLKEFELEKQSFSVDKSKVEKYLKGLAEMQEENMIEPQNAYVKEEEDGTKRLKIVPETYGYKIELKEASEFVAQNLGEGKSEIDLTPVTKIKPDILSTDPTLVDQVNKVNNALKATITFVLRDGSKTSLNASITKTWIELDEETGTYDIDIEKNVAEYVKSLNITVKHLGANIPVKTLSGETIILPVPQERFRDCVNVEEEIEAITQALQNGTIEEREPIYERINRFEDWKDYSILELDPQKVYLKINEEFLLDGAPTVTGTKGTSRETPKGVFFLFFKKSPKEFIKYGGTSKYWVQFTDDGIGFHDATWRKDSDFVQSTADTRGSHGCANMQEWSAKIMYENSYIGMPVIVY